MYKENKFYIVDRDQMRKIDHYSINKLEIPAICLVERAALALMKNIDLDIRHSFAIIVGVGNNGADGLALARNLLARGKYVDLYILGNLEKASDEYIKNLNAVKNMTKRIFPIKSISDMEFLDKNLDKVNTIVDGIFGTGLSRTIDNEYLFVIDLINRKRIYTISIDLPSGLDANTGENFGDVVDSDLIVSMQCNKKGLYNNRYFKDKVVVEDIGLPESVIKKVIDGRI